MLYKDNQPYKLSTEEIKKYSGKKTFLLARGTAKFDQTDQRVRRPNSLRIEPHYILTDPETGATTEIRYAATAPQMRSDQGISYQQWNPSEIVFPQKGKLTVTNDAEMNYFMSNHPKNADSPKPAIRTSFYAENKELTARQMMQKEKMKFDAKALIISENGMSKEDLLIIARSYPDLIGFCDEWEADKDDSVLKANLVRKAELDPDMFFKNAHSPKTKIKNTINLAVRANIIKYNQGTKQWNIVEDNVTKETVCSVKNNEKPLDKLIEHLSSFDKKGHLQYIEAKLNKTEPAANEV